MAKVRSIDFLPTIFQTPVNRQFLSATVDQLIQEPSFNRTQGFIGRTVGPGTNANDTYVTELDKVRTDYQLEPGVIIREPGTNKVIDAITYPGINDALLLQGAKVARADRLFKSDYYAWDPFVDLDKFSNFSQYYWLPSGPDPVDVGATVVPLTDDFVVTRENGAYSFSGQHGNNPPLTLVRGGNYTFSVAQNDKETINFRVTNQSNRAYLINYASNPTLTLVRGNSYVFNLSLDAALPFWIKTKSSIDINDSYSSGVTNNGAASGLITFVVPQDAPDTLFYACQTAVNMTGRLNIVDRTSAIGPGFWIQSNPGVEGTLPSSPNISSRNVLGVSNNGEDLGTVQFNVPLSTAQNFYYNLTSIGTVDLVTNLKFNQINNISLDPFLEEHGGIDGLTQLDGRTVAFLTTEPSEEVAGWDVIAQFDPLPAGQSNNGLPGAYDTLLFDETSPVPTTSRYSFWRIRYLTTSDGTIYMRLESVKSVAQFDKFKVLYGSQYSSYEFFKNSQGYFEEIPLLTAIKNVLYYQDGTDPGIFGIIRLVDPENDKTLDIDQIIGSKTYTSQNGVVFSNGMKVQFRGDVTPSTYINNMYYVEGVGTSIQLLPTINFVTPETYTLSESIPYDSEGFDVNNFDANIDAPTIPDYLTINRSSLDSNAWSRSNRWFHIDVINATAEYNNQIALLDNNFRAKRPILEFKPNLRLFNYGTQAKQPVDIIDFSNTDAFSNINGTIGYGLDGYTFLEGTRVIFARDADPEVRGKIFEVQFISPDEQSPIGPQPIINLVAPADSAVEIDQIVVCLAGLTLQGKAFYYTGNNWVECQQKTKINQAPLFEVYDVDEISFKSDKYFSSTFSGTKLFSYAEGTAKFDPVLGFPLKYLSLKNIGDIVFDNNFYVDTFIYIDDNVSHSINISQGFVRQYTDRTDYNIQIGWQPGITKNVSRQQLQFSYNGNPIQLDIKANIDSEVPAIILFVGSEFVPPTGYTVTRYDTITEIRLLNNYEVDSVVEVSVLSNQESKKGFYQIPTNLEINPFNTNSPSFTLGTVRTHYQSIGQHLSALTGTINGANNSRDLGNIIPYGQKILQQSSPLTLTGYFLRNSEYEIFSALSFNSREYNSFKNRLLDTVIRNDYTNLKVPEMLTSAIADITDGRSEINPFYWGDMLPAGHIYNENKTTYSFISTPVFDLLRSYDFSSSNYQGLLVYVNDELLLIGYDYTVAIDGPRLTITSNLEVGDIITIREYVSTVGNFVPNTPTKLGLYPAYKPEIFSDVNAITPTQVIRGHDGSITRVFGDIRDDVLLEFERRIYNNLKIKSAIPLATVDVIPGQFRQTDYSLRDVTDILSKDFLIWVGNNHLDYKEQSYRTDNEFTWNYSVSSNKLTGQPLLGGWRGNYRYFYDTETPNLTPWEMLGFSEQPNWWTDRYGPAPYTKDNLVLWDDLETGTVADPTGYYVKPQYIRSRLTQVIPVGGEGALVSPMASIVGTWDEYAFRKSWVVGDGGPVEAAWKNSSDYPFAIMRLFALTKPAEFFSLFVDRDLYKFHDNIGQYLYNNRYRLDAKDIEIYGNGSSKASYINWIVDYNQQMGQNSSEKLTKDLKALNVQLCYRFAGFTDKKYLKIFTEKSSPDSLNTTLLLPDESYNLLLYKNQPSLEVAYSSVLVQKTSSGWTVSGFSVDKPYFEILTSQVPGQTSYITVGDETIRVPMTYTNLVIQIPYGHTFTNSTILVDFLFSYGACFQKRGLQFISNENGMVMDWKQMASEFLYWNQQGWEIGSIINLNPSAVSFKALRPGYVVDNVLSTGPENMILDQNSKPVSINNFVVTRIDNEFTLSTTTEQSIAYLRLKYINYEHIMVLDNSSIFNDLIYDLGTGLRQSRVKISGIVSAEWNGTLDAPGFILNENNIKLWQQNKKYFKGEIVLFKGIYWSAQKIVEPEEKFNSDSWVKSDYANISTGLLPNLANKADQLANSYNTNKSNLESSNDLLSFGLIGFDPRIYMSNLNLDDVSQINIYKQFLSSKGTIGSVELFKNANLGKEVAEYDVFENWAVQRGVYGANANRSYFEIRLNKDLLNNPGSIQLVDPQESSQADQTVLLSNLWKQSFKLPSTDILPTIYPNSTDIALPSAGYVNFDDVDITVFSLDNPTSLADNIDKIGIGTLIWVAKSNNYDWNIYRSSGISSNVMEVKDNLNGTALITFTAAHGRSKNDIIVIRYFNMQVDGVYRVLYVPTPNTIIIASSFQNQNQLKITGNGLAFYLDTIRVAQSSDIASLPYVSQLEEGSKVWVDNDGNGQWIVLQKNKPFTTGELSQPPDIPQGSRFGASISQSLNNLTALVGAPGYNDDSGAIYSYVRGNNNQYLVSESILLNATEAAGFGNSVVLANHNWGVAGASASSDNMGLATVLRNNTIYEIEQLLTAPDGDGSTFSQIEFGYAVTMSDDARWMFISAPNANKVYAYGRVDVEKQRADYFTNGATGIFNYSDNIQVTDENQLSVILNNEIKTLSVDYTTTATSIVFNPDKIPPSDLRLLIQRKVVQEFTADGTTNTFNVSPYLISATDINSCTVTLDGILQRPDIDYYFNVGSPSQIEFGSATPSNDAVIFVYASDHFKYVDTLEVAGLEGNAKFGYSIFTTTDGRLVTVGCPKDSAGAIVDAGAVYVFDRGVVQHIINDPTQRIYAMPVAASGPAAVILNKLFLTDTNYFINGDFTVDSLNIVLSDNVVLQVGDILEIEYNLFKQTQKIIATVPYQSANFGSAVSISQNNCTVYIGAPQDNQLLTNGIVVPAAGSVERNVIQACIYGVISSTISNPSLNTGDTIRINNVEVAVPNSPNNNVIGLSNAINATNIPNVIASVSGGILTIGVKTQISYDQFNKLSVLPGSVGSAFAACGFELMAFSQKIVSPRPTDFAEFGAALDVNLRANVPGHKVDLLMVGAPNGTVYKIMTFDTSDTYFDDYASTFFDAGVQNGVVYTYDYLASTELSVSNPGKMVYGQQIFDNNAVQTITPNGILATFTLDQTTSAASILVSLNGLQQTPVIDYLVSGDQITFTTVPLSSDIIKVTFIANVLDRFGEQLNYTSGILLIGSPGNDVGDSVLANNGRVSIFLNPNQELTWQTLHIQKPSVDINLLNSVSIYNHTLSTQQTYLDFFDPLQGRILGAARSNIDYIGAVDPAFYNVGTVRNNGNNWGSEHIGQIWWDTNRVRFIDPNQDTIEYASRRWGQVFPGSSVDVYQWVESAIPPSAYIGPGVPLSRSSYSIRSELVNTGIFATKYYFWVRNIGVVSRAAKKTLSISAIAAYIGNPRGSGIPYLAALDASTVVIYNSADFISAQDSILRIEYDREINDDNIHSEYELIADGKEDSFLSAGLYKKFQDSLCGVNEVGSAVPDPFLAPSEKFGVQFRPRQAMFADRFIALENYIKFVNRVFESYPITENRKFSLLNSAEPLPSQASGAWNKKLASIEELSYQNINVVSIGYKYLVVSAATQHGLWSIYEVANSDIPGDPRRLNLVRVQTYDTTKYWHYVNWYLPGYNTSARVATEVSIYSLLETLPLNTIPIGSSVKVTANGQGKFEIYLRTESGWERVGLEDGTIQINKEIWDYSIGRFGFDIEVFDAQYFDQEPTIETRKIIQAINEELLIDDLLSKRNSALILMFNYVLSEFNNPEWLIKTSLIDVTHKIRDLIPYQIYLEDNQNFVIDYIKEVKPYHVQIREFNLTYNGIDTMPGTITDFDVPVYFNTTLLSPKFTSPILLPYTLARNSNQVSDSDIAADSLVWTDRLWNEWYNNYLLSVDTVVITNGGAGYTEPPIVTVTGDCLIPAEFNAIVNSAGIVVSVDVINFGSGYRTTAILTLTGGNGSGATAVALMGNDLVRQFTTTIKYDRCEYRPTLVNWEANVSYDNGTMVRYLDQVWEADNSDSTAVLSLTFDPDQWNKVGADTLSGIDRTMGFYLPRVNEPGLDITQLIKGIEYPGVQIVGPRFNQNSGFDVGNFDINSWDNISYGPEGRVTYDPDILDAEYSSSYTDSALGTRTTDITVDGGEYVGLFESHAPEELIPGAIFDTLDLRVYVRPGSDWDENGHGFLTKSLSTVFNSVVPIISFVDLLPYNVVISVTNQATGSDLQLATNYTINWVDQYITMLSGALNGDVITINGNEVGGGNQLFKENYNGGTVGQQIIIPVIYSEIQELVIFVNGVIISTYTESSYNTRFTRINFASTYTISDAITVVAFGETILPAIESFGFDVAVFDSQYFDQEPTIPPRKIIQADRTVDYSWSIPHVQNITADGSLTYSLTNSLEFSNSDNMIVTVNGVRSRMSAGIEYYGDGSTEFLIPYRLGFSQGIISDSEVHVYLDEVLQIYGVDYVLESYDPLSGHGDRRAIQFMIEPTGNQRITIYVTTNSQCYVDNNQLVFNPVYGMSPVNGDAIIITTWNDTRQQDILTQVFVGPIEGESIDIQEYDMFDFDSTPFDFSQVLTLPVNNLDLGRTCKDTSCLHVTLNGIHIFSGQDFIINGHELILSTGLMFPLDTVIITQFTESKVPEAMAFRIFQNMRGTQSTYRITPETTTSLSQALDAAADVIYVKNALALNDPTLALNLWGILTVDGERIFYRNRNISNNSVSGLIRGISGTGVSAHSADSFVYNAASENLLPSVYQNAPVVYNQSSDGETTSFITDNIFLNTSELTAAVEVWVGGTKQVGGYVVTGYAPVAVLFNSAPADGRTVTIGVIQGKTWYDLGAGTASNGVALQESTNIAARFLRGE